MNLRDYRNIALRCIVCLACVAFTLVQAEEAPVKEFAISEKLASACLGKEAKRLVLTSHEDGEGKYIRPEVKSFFERHGISIFRADNDYYAFTGDHHVGIAGGPGNCMLNFRGDDFNDDGRDDLIASYLVGSGMPRYLSFLMIDSNDGLRLYLIGGVPVKKDRKWCVTHPLSDFGATWRDKAVAVLAFNDRGISVSWPAGIQDEEKWQVANECGWAANEPVQGAANRRP